MVTVFELVGFGVLVAANTAIAAVVTRLLRVRLTTTWGTVLYVGVFVPLALALSTILMGILLGPDLGNRAAAVGLLILAPMTLGVSIDVLWMPAPDEVELPDTADG